jgi:hypothetical protein
VDSAILILSSVEKSLRLLVFTCILLVAKTLIHRLER